MARNLSISSAGSEDIPLIQKIARETWPDTFSRILSTEQIEYMLDMMYNAPLLREQMQNPDYHYYLIDETKGFAALEFNYLPELHYSKIHKFYIHPFHQHAGIGRQAMEFMVHTALENHQQGLILNVNKQNPATRFYEKMGFDLWKSEIIDIGKGYVMDDYVYCYRI